MPSPAYQATRDALSRELFDVMDVVCGHRWTDDEIGGLLLRLSVAMSNEVDVLAGLPPVHQVAMPTSVVCVIDRSTPKKPKTSERQRRTRHEHTNPPPCWR